MKFSYIYKQKFLQPYQLVLSSWVNRDTGCSRNCIPIVEGCKPGRMYYRGSDEKEKTVPMRQCQKLQKTPQNYSCLFYVNLNSLWR